MPFLLAHRLLLGIVADTLTLAGGLVLAFEAFCRLKDLIEGRINARFKEQFPGLPLVDEEKIGAHRSVVRAYIGCAVILLGYVLEVLTRIAEA